MAKFLEPRQGDLKRLLKRAVELAKTNDVAIWVNVAAVPELVMHLPKTVDSLHFAANVAANGIKVELGVGCADRDGARWASKALRTRSFVLAACRSRLPQASRSTPRTRTNTVSPP